MAHPNGPSGTQSPQGRRVLVALVTGPIGDRIQDWRTLHDPVEAARIPPHATLCYWVPGVEPELLGQQVRHAFAGGVRVRLGAVRRFESEQQTVYVEMEDTGQLDQARKRLYDGRFVELGELREWPWHVSCVRDSRGRDSKALAAATAGLHLNEDWPVNTVACLELRGERYCAVETWLLER